MKSNNVYITETLQNVFEIEADSEEEAFEKAKQMYDDGKLYLDYSNIVDVEFSNCKLSKKEIEIFSLTEKYCKEECEHNKNCLHDKCLIFKIKYIIEE